jgi:hypothetical protein
MPYVALDRLDAEAAPVTTIGAPTIGNGMSLAAFDDELNAMLVGRTDVGPARRRLWTNMAYTDVATSLKLPELIGSIEVPLVADQFLYGLPPAVYSIISVSMIDDDEDTEYGGRPLEGSSLNAFRSRQMLTGRVREFFRSGQMLVVWPTPEVGGTMVVDFRIRPTWMSADAHCPILYVEWHEGILLKARHKAFHALQEIELSMAANNDFIQFMRSRQSQDAVEEENQIRQSSVPRDGVMLKHPRGYPTRWRTRDG